MVERQNQGRILFFGGGEGSPGVHHIVDDGGDKHTGGAVETFTCPLRFVAVLARGLQKSNKNATKQLHVFDFSQRLHKRGEGDSNPQPTTATTTDN